MNIARLIGLASMAALIWVGCNNGTSPDLTGGGDDPGGSGDFTTVGRVTGHVTMPDGTPIEGVTVDLIDVATATTDADGLYVLTDVEPAEAMRMRFTAHGYSSNMRVVTVNGWETRTVNARLLPVDVIATLRSADGGRIETDQLRMDFPVGAFVDASGQPFSGDVDVAVTYIDPSTIDIMAAPGQFTAITDGGADSGLMSYAMVDVSMTAGDEEIELADGLAAGVELLLPADLPDSQAVQAGDQIPTWHFDEDLVTWVQEGWATVVESATTPGRLAATMEAPYFSAWNVDDCFVTPDMDPAAAAACMQTPVTCVTGDIVDVGGNEVIGADIIGGNINLFGTVADQTDDNGTYVLFPVQVSAAIDISASATVGGTDYSVMDGSFIANGPAGADGSDPSACVQIPDIVLPTCVVGGVVSLERDRMYVPENPDIVSDGFTGKGYFFEPDGTPETCININPTVLPVDDCEIVTTDDVDDDLMDFFWGQAPLDAGVDLELSDGTDTMDLAVDERIVGDFYYEGVASDDEVGFSYDSVIDIRANGQQGGLPPTDLPASLPLGPEMIIDDHYVDHGFTINRGDRMQINANSDSDSWGTIAILAPEDSDTGCLCRFEDDGNFEIPSDITSQLGTGNAALVVTRVTTEMTSLPNGYWLRSMGRSTTAVIGEINP